MILSSFWFPTLGGFGRAGGDWPGGLVVSTLCHFCKYPFGLGRHYTPRAIVLVEYWLLIVNEM
jgi:hypothetical protein